MQPSEHSMPICSRSLCKRQEPVPTKCCVHVHTFTNYFHRSATEPPKLPENLGNIKEKLVQLAGWLGAIQHECGIDTNPEHYTETALKFGMRVGRTHAGVIFRLRPTIVVMPFLRAGVLPGGNNTGQNCCVTNSVRNLFGVFKGLHGYTLGYAFAHLYHAKGFG